MRRLAFDYKKHLPSLDNLPAFGGFNQTDLAAVLSDAQVCIHVYKKGEIVSCKEGMEGAICVILAGNCNSMLEDSSGDQIFLEHLELGGVFTSSIQNLLKEIAPLLLFTTSETSILVISRCSLNSSCKYCGNNHMRLLSNLFLTLERKYADLVRKVYFVSRGKAREKLLKYLNHQALIHTSDQFTTPLNLTELANYLDMDRTTLSSELRRLERDGVLIHRKNSFCLLRQKGA